jgi:hypothetical protein
MPVSWSVEAEGRFVVLLPTDPATIEEWRTAMLEVLAAPIARPHLAMLVDRRHAQAITKDFVVQMTGFFSQHQKALVGSRRAIVVNDDAGFGMGRMTELLAALPNPDSTIRVVRAYDAAAAWLTTPDGAG